MRMPGVFLADQVKTCPDDDEVAPGVWMLARPTRYDPPWFRRMGWRFKWTWAVFRGKADVLQWARDLPDDELAEVVAAMRGTE